MMTSPLLEVRDLSIAIRGERGSSADTRLADRRLIVEGLSFAIERGETLAMVGESGCGKTVTAYAALRLLDPPLAILGGSIRFDGQELTILAERALQSIRGRRIAMIFQEPMTALNPVLTVGDQIAECLILHRGLDRRAARDQAIERMREVGIAEAERRVDAFPHQMSGGMRQRVMIAMALACDPELLIADEPTTALDVTIQAQILALLRSLQERRRMAILLITHDLGVVAELAHRVAVMYAGRVVEHGMVGAIFDRPQHPYTQALFRSRPQHAARGTILESIDGAVPAPGRWPQGCVFHPRCREQVARCRSEVPRLVETESGAVACLLREGSAK